MAMKKNGELSNHTKNKLKSIGRKGMTYDEIVLELLEHADTCERFWVDRL
ncbi:hypothetical protein [Nitrosopumilus sp.]